MGLRPKPPASASGDPFAPRRACRAAPCAACRLTGHLLGAGLPQLPLPGLRRLRFALRLVAGEHRLGRVRLLRGDDRRLLPPGLPGPDAQRAAYVPNGHRRHLRRRVQLERPVLRGFFGDPRDGSRDVHARRPGRSRARVLPTRSPSQSPATGWSGPTAGSAAIAGAWNASGPCSPVRPGSPTTTRRRPRSRTGAPVPPCAERDCCYHQNHA